MRRAVSSPWPAVLIVLVACGASTSDEPQVPSRCDPEAADQPLPQEGCVDVAAGLEDHFVPKMSVSSTRPFRDKVCLSARFSAVEPPPGPYEGPFDDTNLELCLGVVDLGPARSFTLQPVPLDRAIPPGSAALVYTHTKGSYAYPSEGPSKHPLRSTESEVTLRGAAGRVECERGELGLACRLRGVRFEDPADPARTGTGSAWLHAAPPPEPVACDPPLAACPDEPEGSPTDSCIGATGDAIRPATATFGNTAIARDGQTCIAGYYEPKCNSGDGENRSESHNFFLCLGSSSPIAAERTFTINGEFPHDTLAPPEGEASFSRREFVGIETYDTDGLKPIGARSWRATSGSITCARRADYLACRFTGIPFEESDTKTTSTASGWIHTSVYGSP